MISFSKEHLKQIALFSIFLFSVCMTAQEIGFGAKAGLNISSLRGDYPQGVDKKPAIGFHIGGFAQYDINEQLAIQPELLFSMQGVITELVQEDFSLTQTYRLNYFNLALMGKYKVIDKLSVEFGPQIGYTLSAKSKWDYKDAEDSSRNETITVDLLNEIAFDFQGETIEGQGRINRFDLGLNLGASYDLNKNMFVQARYNFGIVVVDNNSTAPQSTNSWNLKNSVLQLSVGYKF